MRVCSAPSVPSTPSAYLRKRFITPVSAVVLLSPPLSSSLTWVQFFQRASSLEGLQLEFCRKHLIETPMSDRRLRSPPLPEPESPNTIWRIWLWIPTAVRSACSLRALGWPPYFWSALDRVGQAVEGGDEVVDRWS